LRCSRHAAPGGGAGAELRRRRMRLNLGVRLRHQPRRREHRSSVDFQAACSTTYSPIRRPGLRSPRLTSWSGRQVAEQQHRAATVFGFRRLAATHLRGTGFYYYTPAAPDGGAADDLLKVPGQGASRNRPRTPAALHRRRAAPEIRVRDGFTTSTPPSGLRRQAASRISAADSSTAAPDSASVRQPTTG
jgi:hypothetical protein